MIEVKAANFKKLDEVCAEVAAKLPVRGIYGISPSKNNYMVRAKDGITTQDFAYDEAGRDAARTWLRTRS